MSFSADAYLNEMGITSPLQPTENTSNGNPVPEDDIVDDGVPPRYAELAHHGGRHRGQRAVQSGRL